MAQSSRPLIGITTGLTHNKAGSPICQVGQAYSLSIQNAGGIPVLIAIGSDADTLSALLQQVDGLLFSGGGDIDPKHFIGDPHPKVYGISPERDVLEFFLVEKALAVDLPLLAICRGVQVLNVALGGSLYTHISDQLENPLKHDWFPGYPRDKRAHRVQLNPGSKLSSIYGSQNIPVNSLHHQGIQRVGDGIQVTATAPDSLVEGLEVVDASFAVGVQWHPECLPDDPGSQALFRAFITAAANYANG